MCAGRLESGLVLKAETVLALVQFISRMAGNTFLHPAWAKAGLRRLTTPAEIEAENARLAELNDIRKAKAAGLPPVLPAQPKPLGRPKKVVREVIILDAQA